MRTRILAAVLVTALAAGPAANAREVSERADMAADGEVEVSNVSGEVEIIGGSGKWSGATGSGTIRPKHSAGVRGSYHYAFEITTP